MKRCIALTLWANVLFGLIPVYWKLLSAVSPGYILGQRILWSVPFTLALVLLTRQGGALRAALKNRRALLLTLLAGVVITGNWYLYIWAVSAGMVMETSMAYFIAPLLAFLLGVVCFRERCRPNELLGVCVAAAGILVYSLRVGLVPWLSLGLAVSFAGYGGLKKAAGLSPAVSLTLEMSALLPFALLYLSRTSFGPAGALTGLPLSQLFLLVGTGAVSALPLWLYSFGVKGLPFSLVGVLQYAWPTTSLLLSLLVFRETLSPAKFLCFVTVWCGLLVFSLPSLFRRTVSTKWQSHFVE
jgi:chloramphenicol-sensitive protein RarD